MSCCTIPGWTNGMQIDLIDRSEKQKFPLRQQQKKV